MGEKFRFKLKIKELTKEERKILKKGFANAMRRIQYERRKNGLPLLSYEYRFGDRAFADGGQKRETAKWRRQTTGLCSICQKIVRASAFLLNGKSRKCRWRSLERYRFMD